MWKCPHLPHEDIEVTGLQDTLVTKVEQCWARAPYGKICLISSCYSSL